ncbi:hypothetical protein [Clostridium tagluense]|uniref:Phage exported protein n=1 Tax=Clostridium tagluense TaxID=360422 RepID=A0A401UQE1_9CLOT|nr:hypothetical protein [Clostridium tagluense]GCD11772.1 hypothetical protein Ctaglu_33950 [Clostridium tagluense]
MNKLKDLLEVKKLIAILFAVVFSILSLRGKVTSEQFIIVFTTILSFYYGQSSARGAIKENK